MCKWVDGKGKKADPCILTMGLYRHWRMGILVPCHPYVFVATICLYFLLLFSISCTKNVWEICAGWAETPKKYKSIVRCNLHYMANPWKSKNVRIQLEMSQKKLANALGVSFATINRWENSRNEPSQLAKNSFYEFCESNFIDVNELKKLWRFSCLFIKLDWRPAMKSQP